jgi:hypothetical protein
MAIYIFIFSFERTFKTIYNIAFVNSERWLAKSRVDITQCQHGKVRKFISLCFFVLYYKTNIKHFFRIDIQLYQHGKCFVFVKYKTLLPFFHILLTSTNILIERNEMSAILDFCRYACYVTTAVMQYFYLDNH